MPSPSKIAPQTKGPQKLQPTTGSLITRVLHSTAEVEMHSHEISCQWRVLAMAFQMTPADLKCLR